MADEKQHFSFIIAELNDLQESRNFWKWLALVSWILIGLAAALQIIPIR